MSQLLGRINRKSNFISHYLGHVLQKFDKCAQFLVVNRNHSILEEFITIDVKFHFPRPLVRGDVDDGVAVVRLVAGGGHRLPLPPGHHAQARRLVDAHFLAVLAAARAEARLEGGDGRVLAGLGPGQARGGAAHRVRPRRARHRQTGPRLPVGQLDDGRRRGGRGDAGDLLLGVPLSHSPPSHTGISAGSFTSLMQHFSQEPQNA